MLHRLGMPIQKWDWYEFDNRCRLVRLGGLQPAPLAPITLGTRHDIFANRLAQIVNTMPSQHLAELNNNPPVTSLVASSQPQTDHLNAEQTNNLTLDPQLEHSDLESTMSRNGSLASQSSWKKTPMQLPTPSPNFPISDVSYQSRAKHLRPHSHTLTFNLRCATRATASSPWDHHLSPGVSTVLMLNPFTNPSKLPTLTLSP